MSIGTALNTALFGLTHNKRQMELTSSNVANAHTEGYSRKELNAKVFFDNGGNVSGLVSTRVERYVNSEIQNSYFTSLPEKSYASTMATYTAKVDSLLGSLNNKSGLSALAARFSKSLSALVNTPSHTSARQQVVADAKLLAHQINNSHQSLASLRKETDNLLRTQADEMANILDRIKDVEGKMIQARNSLVSTANLEDQRDRYVEQLSSYVDVNVQKQQNGTLEIKTFDGQMLYSDLKPSKFSFQSSGNLQPGQAGNQIMVTTPGKVTFNLVDASRSGSVVALTKLRDETLVKAQNQLDTLAAEMALAVSNVPVEGASATVGSDTGFDLDLSQLQAGNKVTLDYVNASGEKKTVTFVAVKDAGLLPLNDDVTSRTDDKVYGVDISSGNTANYITQMTASLGASGLTVSNNGTGKLRVIGNTGASIKVESLSAKVTPTADSNQGLGLAIFVDKRNGEDRFTDALENGKQRVGFAGGIGVNSALLNDNSLLINYKTTPTANSPSDSARAQFLHNAVTAENITFDPASGIGSNGGTYKGSVLTFSNQVIAFQGRQAEDAKFDAQSKTAITSNLAVRYEKSYSVNVDAEMGFLVQLQHSYAANARVMQAAKEMLDTLMKSI